MMKHLILSTALILVCTAAIVGCPHPAPCTSPGAPANLYHDTSMTNINPANIFYNAIPNWDNGNVSIDTYSSQVMSHLQECVAATGGRQPFWSSAWATPWYYADASVPKVNVRLTHQWSGADWLLQQRVPCWADHDDGSTDMPVMIYNLVEGCQTGFWGFNADWENINTFPCAETGGAWPIDYDGTNRPQMGVDRFYSITAAGLGPIGVFPDELTDLNNPINHGFTFAYIADHVKQGVAHDPAINKADGYGTCEYDMCEGFRIQLNPSYTYGSERKTWERKYMDALKKYGAWHCDMAAYLSWRSLPHKKSCTNNPFAGIFPDEQSLETSTGWDARFPLDQFRLIARGALLTSPVAPVQSNVCGEYDGWDGTPNPGPAAPTLTGISPSTAAASSTVTLTGTNLTGTYRVLFGDAEHSAWNPTVLSSTQVAVVVPSGSGTVGVSAKTAGGQSGTVSFTYSGGGGSAPTLSSITPNSGTTAGGTACTLAGSNMTGTASVSFSGSGATGVTVDSSSQVRCTSPAHSAGGVTVTATNSYGTSNGVAYTYSTPAPTLSAIAPTSGTTAGGTACTLTGTNLTGCSAVSFGGSAATGIAVDSSTQVRCASPAKSAGAVGVTATTAGGSSGAVTYTYTTAPPSYTATLYSPHDAYVKSNSTNKNFGTTNLVIQKNASLECAVYMKFDLNSVSGSSIISATLNLCTVLTPTSAFVQKIYSCTADDSWSESTIKWGSGRPAWGTQQTSFTCPSTQYAWVSVDVSSYVGGQFSGDKLVTLVIRDDQNLNKNCQYYSDETGASTSRRPYLVVISS